MSGGSVRAFIVALVAVCAAPAVGQEYAPGELVLGSELERSIIAPEATQTPVVERLPEPTRPTGPELILLPPVEAPANDERLTLERVESMATAFHPALRQAAGRMRAAQGNWVQVGLGPNPVIGYSGEEIGDDGTAGKQGGFVAQEFVTAGKLRLNRAVASRDVAAAQQQWELARLRVLTSVRILYFDVLAAQRTVALARRLSEVAGESVRTSELRLKALDIPRVSLLQSQIERESAALIELQATERHAASWRRLATAIGTDGARPRELDDVLLQPLPELEWDDARRRVFAENPELAALRFAVDRARWAVQRASAGRVPNVSLETGVAHDNATGDAIANVRLSMPLPVCDRNQGAIAKAYGELAAAQAALEERELALEQRLAAAMRDYTTARLRARRYSDQVLPVARESLDMINAGYREGELDYLSVLTMQQTFAEKNLAYLQDLETAWKKWAEIDGLLVGPLTEQTE